MAIDKSVMKEAFGNVRKELRGYKPVAGKPSVTITIEHGTPGEHEGEEEVPEGETEKPDLLDKAMRDLKKK